MSIIWRRLLRNFPSPPKKKSSGQSKSPRRLNPNTIVKGVHKTWRWLSSRILPRSPFTGLKISPLSQSGSHFSSLFSSNCMKMVAEAEIVVSKNPPAVLEGPLIGKVNDHSRRCRLVGDLDSPSLTAFQSSELVSADLPALQLMDRKSTEQVPALEPSDLHYSPTISSGSYADIGPRRFMEDEHVRMDDLSSDAISLIKFPKPSAFYAVFDGHGGAEASNFVSKNAKRLFFEDVDFPNSMEVDEGLVAEAENSLRCSFRLADQALAKERSVSSSCGTTALAALVLGSVLIVANVGDCRAVLCRGGEAVDMSNDHRPTHPSERRRVVEMGGFVDDGYLNGILSVTRALGDWDLKKFAHNSPSPLISEPEITHSVLTEEDEFLIMGCDGIWDVMSSQQAVTLVRRGLRRHGDLDQCARDLVREALRRNSFDNLTVIVVCFYAIDRDESYPPRQQKLRCCNLSAETFYSLKSWLDSSSSH